MKLGYFVQVYGNVDGNGDLQKPGVYLNHDVVSLQGYGPEISFGPDIESIGFGASGTVPGMSTAPVGMTAPPPVTASAPVAPVNTAPPPPVQTVVVPAAPAAIKPVVNVAPHPPILMTPGVAPPPPVAAAPPPRPAHVMLPAANGATYEALIAAGWTDALLVQHGMMQA